jgi:hydrogenobyrinic acid a,c-diamide synthase (glutamine-hydrolysing) (EC 6.3.5.9)/cobyrinate a,c-diamide synthase (EC 6.3.5.-)
MHYKREAFLYNLFKVGPDYIDPSYLTSISKNDTYNLDVWLMGQKQVLDSFISHSKSDISIIEGVMGYYDGFKGNF